MNFNFNFYFFGILLCILTFSIESQAIYGLNYESLPEIQNMLYPEKFPNAWKKFPFSFEEKYFFIKPYILKHKRQIPSPEKPFYMGYDEFLKMELKTDWDIQRKSINVEQMRKGIVAAWGAMLPRLSVTVTTNPFMPIDPSTMFKGLFGFLIPANWFKLFTATHLKKAEYYSYIDLLLNKYLLTQIAYISTHRAKWDYLIYEIYALFLWQFISELQADPEFKDKRYMGFLQTYFFDLQKVVAVNIGDLNERLPALAKLGNISDMYKINNFQIRPIPLPKMDNTNDLTPYPYEQKAFENSLTLKVIRQTQTALKAKIGTTLTAGVGVSDERAIGISLGLDTFVNGLIVQDDIKKLEVTYKEVEADIRASVVVAAKNYNRALVGYRSLSEGLWSYQNELENMILDYRETHTLSLNFHHLIGQIINNLQVMNGCYHMMLISAATINRFLVGPSLLEIHQLYPDAQFIKGYPAGSIPVNIFNN